MAFKRALWLASAVVVPLVALSVVGCGSSSSSGGDDLVPDGDLGDASDSAIVVDSTSGDSATIDSTTTNTGSSDTASADSAVDDSTIVDSATTDSASTDSAKADSASSDSATTDSATADTAIDSARDSSGDSDAPADSIAVGGACTTSDECASGLLCCNLCGTPGCHNLRCATPIAGRCPLIP